MEKKNKEDLMAVTFFGLVAQLFIYGAYRYFHKLNTAIILFTYMAYMLFVWLSYIIGLQSTKKKKGK
ncbi:hypothetical protein LCGC14_0569990 [marine sediment metagenome]|uniref:Uncharacterized protein n=1 Tax=marine sediment metagenome TaxID=412755 RepID=A0A0F9S362_9ZZZZ